MLTFFTGHFSKSETVLEDEFFTAFHIYVELYIPKGINEEFLVFKLYGFEL